MSILYSKTEDVNFKEFYDFESAQVAAKLVLDELEAIQRSNRLADESGTDNHLITFYLHFNHVTIRLLIT